MNELGNTDQQSTDDGRGAPGSVRGECRPAGRSGVRHPGPQGSAGWQPAQYGSPQDSSPQYGPQYGPQYAGPQYAGSQYTGSQYTGSQYTGPRYAGPQHGGPQYAGPQAGPQFPGPHGPGESYPRPYAPNAGAQSAGRQYGGPPSAGPHHDGAHDRGSAAPNAGWPGAERQPAGSIAASGPQHIAFPVGAYPGPGIAPDGGSVMTGAGAEPAGAATSSSSSPPRRRGRVARWIGVGVVVAALGGVGWYVTFGAPSPVTATVGDCVSQTGENDVAVVGCGEPSAQFRVAGKVEDKTMIAASLFACSDFPDATSSFWQGVQDQPGTVLCLAPLHP